MNDSDVRISLEEKDFPHEFILDNKKSGISLGIDAYLGFSRRLSADNFAYDILEQELNKKNIMLDMPRLIYLLEHCSNENYLRIRRDYVLTNSGLYFVRNKGEIECFATHSQGPFTDQNGSDALFRNPISQQFAKLDIEDNNMFAFDDNIFHLYDALDNFNYTPLPEKYTLWAQFSDLLIHRKKELTHNEWATDDKILLETGGRYQRDALGDLLFGREQRNLVSNQLLPTTFYRSMGGIMSLAPRDHGIRTCANTNQEVAWICAKKNVHSPTFGSITEQYLLKETINELI